MKKTAVFAVLCATLVPVLVGLTGCGGSNGGNPAPVTPRFIPVTVTLNWQALASGSRAVNVPTAARSAVIRLSKLTQTVSGGPDLVTIAVLNRRTDATGPYSQRYVSDGVVARPNALTYSEIQFWSEPNATGTLLTSVSKRATLPADGQLGEFNEAR